MEEYLLAVAIVLPALSAVLCYLIRKPLIRSVVVILSAFILFAVAGEFTYLLYQAGGKLVIDFEDTVVPAFSIDLIIKILDFVLLLYVLYIGFKLKNPLIIILTVLQTVPLVIFEVFGSIHEPKAAFIIDHLSLIMILLVSIIGPVIMFFALGYMEEHEHHKHMKHSKQPKFFMVLFIFLGAMNGLVMANSLLWMYFFWEVTTVCSFLLISHNGNKESINNAARALWINLLGGVAFVAGIIVVYKVTGTLSIEEIIATRPSGAFTGLLPIGLGLLCFAGLTKAAQFPFQSWLLGAMVAPTPVSALLHSSTMVKAGVYLIVRFAPAYSGTLLGETLAVVGGFTFVAASAIAISQRNGKRVLAYSTIANLGLIICCAGIGTYMALGAAVLLIIFHAVSKALLFLCVGTIEHGIGSRDIEDMQGLMKRMPFTTVITVIGMISMLLPPFGVLMTKWLAIEASVNLPVVLLLIVIGSALTVVFWAKWIGIILTMSYKDKYNIEKLKFTVRSSLTVLIVGVLGCSMASAWLFNSMVKPYLNSNLHVITGPLAGDHGGIWLNKGSTGGFALIYFFIIIFVLMITIPYFLKSTKKPMVKAPYLCGENTDDLRGIEFYSPGDKIENVIVHNYYLSGFFGESNLTLWTNLVAGAIILIMFGVVV